jgi:hypothetical protein
LQLRLVDSSTDGPCGESGTTTYHAGASLGEVTPAEATEVAAALHASATS